MKDADNDDNNVLPEEILQMKFKHSQRILDALPYFDVIITTDGGVDTHNKRSAAVAVRLADKEASQTIEEHSEDCGPLACSYRAESRALLLALRRIVLPALTRETTHSALESALYDNEEDVTAVDSLIPSCPQKSVLLITDSLSLLKALESGPMTQESTTEDTIWCLLLQIADAGWHVHLQFVYAHCGIAPNECADKYATDCLVNNTYTEEEPASV